MPLLKHAKKKLKQDKGRTARNKKLREVFRKLVKEAKEVKTPEALSKAFSAIDKAAKQNIMHENKAGRMKSSLNKAMTAEKVVVAKKKPVSKKLKGMKKATPKKGSKKK